MSTRCQIGFYQNQNTKFSKPEVLIYRHSDGYPGTEDGIEYGVLPELIPFLKQFHKNRGLLDTEYAGARTLQHLTNLYDEAIPSRLEESRFLGYGICKEMHGDIEYFYAVYGEGFLKVFEVNHVHPNINKDLTLTDEINLN